MNRADLGHMGEAVAAKYYIRQGYLLLNHNYRTRMGELDLILYKADTIVFDKTGTLTYATPKVAQIITFGDYKEPDMLRLAACLEEHYPHSMANAVVEEAKLRGLSHEEYHSQVQYVVPTAFPAWSKANRC